MRIESVCMHPMKLSTYSALAFLMYLTKKSAFLLIIFTNYLRLQTTNMKNVIIYARLKTLTLTLFHQF